MLELRRGLNAAVLDRREVEHGRFRIGRGRESDWVLPDPERVLSKCHCEVAEDGDGWVVSDTSSNGTILNGASLPQGARAALRDGDRLGLGTYEIGVRTEGAFRAGAPAAGTRALDSLRPDEGDSISDWLDEPKAATSDRVSTEDPFPMPDADEFGFLLPGRDPRAAFEPVGIDTGVDAGFDGSPHPLSELGSDRASNLNAHIRLPRPTAELIPADWDAPPPGDAAPAPPEPAPPTPFPVPSVPSAPVLPAPVPLASVPPASVSPASVLPPSPPAGSEVGLATSAAQDGEAAAGFAAFAEGAGLPGAVIADPARALRALGEAFQALVHELRETMMARAAIKSEFRIEQTMIRPTGNNPLKFAVDDADALSALLGTGRRSGMTPRDAVAGALRDMRLHELAVVSAMQQATRATLAELAPERLEGEERSGRLDAVTGGRDARLWRAFRARHERLVRSLDDDFDSVFGRHFVQAYEAVLRQADEPVPTAREAGRDPVRDLGSDIR